LNEADTRAQYTDPQLKQSGWGEVDGSKILREHRITQGRIQVGGKRAKAEIADYVLTYKNQKLAVIEAKAEGESPTEGAAQAKAYAQKLNLAYAYSTNGKEIFEIPMKAKGEKIIDRFPTPEELWNKIYSGYNDWKTKFDSIPYEDFSGTRKARYYQEIAIDKTLDAVAEGKQRILLTLATGTGKTHIAFQVAWKLFHTRWNLRRDGSRQPRILYLADRNILADQMEFLVSRLPRDRRPIAA